MQLETVRRNPEYSDSLQTLADLNQLIGFLTTEPHELYERVERLELWRLTASQTLLGHDDECTMFALRQLGAYYFFQGRLEEAGSVLRQALHGLETAMNPDHRELVSVINLIAKVYDQQDMFEDAEMMYHLAWRTEEKALGLDSDRTFIAGARIGMFYNRHDDFVKAGIYLSDARVTLDKIKGPYFQRESTTYMELGNFYYEKDQLDEAELMYGRALRSFSTTQDSQAWGTNMAKLALSTVCLRASRDSEAGCYLEQVKEGCEDLYGPFDVLTLFVICELADLCFMTGRTEDADIYCQQAKMGCTKILDPQRPVTIKLAYQLGRFLQREERFEEAEVYFRLAAENYLAVFGTAHSDTISSMFELGRLLYWKGEVLAAESCYQKAKAGYEKISKPDQVVVAHIKYYLGRFTLPRNEPLVSSRNTRRKREKLFQENRRSR